MRILWLTAGLLCVGLGGIGIVVPLMPTTIFFIMAAACFTRSSPRLEQWVLDLPGIGAMVSDFRAGLGMPRRAKLTAIACIVTTVTLGVVFATDNLALRLGAVALGGIGVWYVGWRVPTRESVLAAQDPDRFPS